MPKQPVPSPVVTPKLSPEVTASYVSTTLWDQRPAKYARSVMKHVCVYLIVLSICEGIAAFAISKSLKNFFQKLGWSNKGSTSMKLTYDSVILWVYIGRGPAFMVSAKQGLGGDFDAKVVGDVKKVIRILPLNAFNVFWWCVTVVAMFWTGAYEVIRRGTDPLTYVDTNGVEQFLLDDDGGEVMNDIPWWTTIPHYLLVSLAGALICIPSYDLNYSEVPQSMRSTSISLAFFVNSMGSSLLSIIVLLFGKYIPANLNNGHLEYLFFTLGALMVVNIFFYVVVMNRMKFGINSSSTAKAQESNTA
ncbi:Proton-dependent Oligopeptide Transporter [Phytophthora cinnamomi]|uniref:Proton-dependent Oligopeptide Transporter n=1 Tax=Phytophthora cinnamomi TaxID=4785 RepID=UPI0035596C77|nr:Proton-dependent Oligopeptide Transporter [Phytophthora cinnamomi]